MVAASGLVSGVSQWGVLAPQSVCVVVLDPSLLRLSWNCWNCSCNFIRSLWVSIITVFSSCFHRPVVEHGCSNRASFWSFSVRCAISSVSVCGFVLDPSWLHLSWSCWNCSCNCANSLWGRYHHYIQQLFYHWGTVCCGWTMWCLREWCYGGRCALSIITCGSLILMPSYHAMCFVVFIVIV